MTPPLRALANPLLDESDLAGSRVVERLWRRHQVVRIQGRDSAKQFALGALSRNDHGLAVFDSKRAFLGVEPQFPFARLFIRAVALETVIRKDREDVAAEVNRRIGG